MRRSLLTILPLVAVVVLCASWALTAPKPSAAPSTWELQFSFEVPRPIQVKLPGSDKAATFWYIRYTVTNSTNDEQQFMPDFVLYTDTGQLLRAGKGVPSSVFEAVKEASGDPMLKDQSSMVGRLLRGADNSKDGVAIFTDIEPEAGAFDIFIGGLSGETAVVTLPSPITVSLEGKTIQKDKVVLCKTLQLHFLLPGEAQSRAESEVRFQAKAWVMR